MAKRGKIKRAIPIDFSNPLIARQLARDNEKLLESLKTSLNIHDRSVEITQQMLCIIHELKAQVMGIVLPGYRNPMTPKMKKQIAEIEKMIKDFEPFIETMNYMAKEATYGLTIESTPLDFNTWTGSVGSLAPGSTMSMSSLAGQSR